MKTIKDIAKDLLDSIEGIGRRDALEIAAGHREAFSEHYTNSDDFAKLALWIREIGDAPRDTLESIAENPDGFGQSIFYDSDLEGRRRLAPLDLPGWPACECCGCGCVEQATTTDEGGVPVCEECSHYDVDDETGDVVCSKTEGVELEEITECCGAGGQSRTYFRIAPPEEPEPDPDGEWACYWSTAGDNAGVVARYATEEKALQAVRAKDFPHPSDHTDYLCGYEVRHLGEDGFDGL